MNFILENIGAIKKADIKLSNLSVIAGKNDQGKSTVGKALMVMIKADNMARRADSGPSKKYFDRLVDLIFEGNIVSESGGIQLTGKDNKNYSVEIRNNKCYSFCSEKKKDFVDCTFIQTPLVWDLYGFFSSIQTWQTDEIMRRGEDEFKIKYPYLMWDLYKKLDMDFKESSSQELSNLIADIIGGDFIQERRKYRFYKIIDSKTVSIDLENVASGIKQFGILQTLLKKGRVTPQGFFIFDEPENHLHPTWQLRFAELLVKLSSKGIYIMVNTHSPHMIEAFYRYAIREGVKANFHLAKEGLISQINQSNTETLEKIFKSLNESFVELDKLKE